MLISKIGTSLVVRVGVIRVIASLVAAVLVIALPVGAQQQPRTIDALLARIFSTDDQTPYDLTANFNGTLIVGVKDGQWVGVATGTFHEWRNKGQQRHWRVSVERLDLPLLLRPFGGPLRRAIEERAATQSESLEALRSHDLFILEEQSGGDYVLAGIRRDLVDEAIDRYGHGQGKADAVMRRAIARWLYTAPTMRSWIVRRGGPYSVKAVSDQAGLVQTVTLNYNWGRLNVTFAYVTVDGRILWREVTSDVLSEIEGLGNVTGNLTLTFSQYRLAVLPGP